MSWIGLYLEIHLSTGIVKDSALFLGHPFEQSTLDDIFLHDQFNRPESEGEYNRY